MNFNKKIFSKKSPVNLLNQGLFVYLFFFQPNLRDSVFGTQCEVHIPCIYMPCVSIKSRPEKGLVSVSSRALEGLVSVSSRTVWQTSRSRLGLGSSGLGLGLGLNQKVLSPSLPVGAASGGPTGSAEEEIRSHLRWHSKQVTLASDPAANLVQTLFACFPLLARWSPSIPLGDDLPGIGQWCAAIASFGGSWWSHHIANIHQDFRPSWVCGLWTDCMERTPTILGNKDLSPTAFRSKLKTHLFNS